MGTAVVCVILAVILVFAVLGYRKRLSTGCCGGAGEAPEKKVRVQDRDERHYPIQFQLKIDGMTCQNCARRIENLFNQQEGCWITVDLAKKQAHLRMKEEIPEEQIRAHVKQAGYTVLSIQK